MRGGGGAVRGGGGRESAGGRGGWVLVEMAICKIHLIFILCASTFLCRE